MKPTLTAELPLLRGLADHRAFDFLLGTLDQ